MIVRYGLGGVFKGAERLDKKRFNQPEGVAFSESGELIVSSEGKQGKKGKKGKKAKIFLFSFEE